MKVQRILALLSVAALVLAASGAARADQKGVLAKIDEAEKAEGEAAAAAFESAKSMVEADIANASDYIKSIGGALVKNLGQFAEAAKGAGKKEEEEELDLGGVKIRASNLYGALMPASKGDFAAAAAYIKSVAAGAPEGAKGPLEAAAKGALGEDKEVAMKNVKVGVTLVFLSKALAAANEGDRKTAIGLSAAAVMSLSQQAAFAGEAEAKIREAAAEMKETLNMMRSSHGEGEVEGYMAESITGMMGDVQSAILGG